MYYNGIYKTKPTNEQILHGAEHQLFKPYDHVVHTQYYPRPNNNHSDYIVGVNTLPIVHPNLARLSNLYYKFFVVFFFFFKVSEYRVVIYPIREGFECTLTLLNTRV